MKRKLYLQLALQIIVGMFLAWLTWKIWPFSNTSSSTVDADNAGWLNFMNPNIGMGYFGLVLLLFGLDLFWIVFFVLWLMRRKLGIQSKKDKTLYLP